MFPHPLRLFLYPYVDSSLQALLELDDPVHLEAHEDGAGKVQHQEHKHCLEHGTVKENCLQLACLADPCEEKGCSTNTVVDDSLIYQLGKKKNRRGRPR